MLVRSSRDQEAHLKKDDSQTLCGKQVGRGSIKDLELCFNCLKAAGKPNIKPPVKSSTVRSKVKV
jgi:hypothetical protein